MTGQLALVEVRRLLRNPYLWAVTVATLALLVLVQRNQLPNLAQVTVNAALATFLIAAALLVVANLATLRDQREGVPETLAALPGQAEVRTRAVLLATGCLGAALVVAVIGGFLLIRMTQGPTGGYVDVREAVAAVLAAGVMAGFGVALGRWVPSPIAAPAMLGVLAIGLFMGALLLLAWYLPVTFPYETQVFGRPAWPRLPYLAAVLVLLAGLAMLRHGRRPLRLATVATALAVVVPAGIWVGVAAPSALAGLADQDGPAAGQPDLECAGRNGITYCHFPGFASWIPVWARAAEPVAAAVPPGQRQRMPVIAQHPSDEPITAETGGRVLVRMTWGRGAAEETDRAQLAGQIAGLVTGLADPGLSYTDVERPWCDGRGQARTVVTLWLAGQAAPLRAAAVTTVPADDIGDQDSRILDSYLGPIAYGERELGYAQRLLDRADATDLLWQHWDLLLDPQTTIEAALPLLGLTDQLPPEPLTSQPCE